MAVNSRINPLVEAAVTHSRCAALQLEEHKWSISHWRAGAVKAGGIPIQRCQSRERVAYIPRLRDRVTLEPLLGSSPLPAVLKEQLYESIQRFGQVNVRRTEALPFEGRLEAIRLQRVNHHFTDITEYSYPALCRTVEPTFSLYVRLQSVCVTEKSLQPAWSGVGIFECVIKLLSNGRMEREELPGRLCRYFSRKSH